MSEMVERVAKVLQAADESFAADEALDPANIELARAAIEAMREPTEAMKALDASLAAVWDSNSPPRLTSPLLSHTGASWSQMIDAALKEP